MSFDMDDGMDGGFFPSAPAPIVWSPEEDVSTVRSSIAASPEEMQKLKDALWDGLSLGPVGKLTNPQVTTPVTTTTQIQAPRKAIGTILIPMHPDVLIHVMQWPSWWFRFWTKVFFGAKWRKI